MWNISWAVRSTLVLLFDKVRCERKGTGCRESSCDLSKICQRHTGRARGFHVGECPGKKLDELIGADFDALFDQLGAHLNTARASPACRISLLLQLCHSCCEKGRGLVDRSLEEIGSIQQFIQRRQRVEVFHNGN